MGEETRFAADHRHDCPFRLVISTMSDDEKMQVDDEDFVPVSNKGKGKAVDTDRSDDNLPW